jgi:signal transduction histidine kinase
MDDNISREDNKLRQQELLDSLMHRTRQIHTSIEVARDIATAPALGDLFELVVNTVQQRFGYYHAQIYTLENNQLLLQEGTGEIGRQLKETGHRISLPATQSLIARAATTGQAILVPNVAQEPSWLANPMLPETKSEIAVPIKWGDKVLGVLDVQSEAIGGLDREDELLLMGLCSLIAVAVNNHHLEEERRQAQESLKQYALELERSNRELEEFAYVASHDLQEPLRIISSYLQLLSRRYSEQFDEDGQRFIHYTVDAADRLRELIDDLLAYSRVGTQGQPFTPTDCEVVLQEALINLQLVIEENSAVITYDPLPTVMGDTTQLRQLFQNLLGNAIKFHSDKPPHIHIGSRRETGHWLLWVQDNGIGLDPKFAERIFAIFQRLHNRGDYPGTGIGLTICKKIVERHNGRIWVESQPGQGTTFYFTLPTQ